ncbi:MAG TPA: hypothetical protein VG897_17100 [Terriglobales bacterium]|nr:hypothetical protein [Terriglobales bacterium]
MGSKIRVMPPPVSDPDTIQLLLRRKKLRDIRMRLLKRLVTITEAERDVEEKVAEIERQIAIGARLCERF